MIFHALKDPLKYIIKYMIHCTCVIYLYFGVGVVISIIILYRCLHVFSNLSLFLFQCLLMVLPEQAKPIQCWAHKMTQESCTAP